MAYGPVLARVGDYFGSTVNLAARLVDQAVPGEILVTRELAEQSGHTLEPAGRRMLKGFSEPVAVYSLTEVRM
jgi:class 3 adenylate cyclase